MQPWSHITPIDSSAPAAKSGKIWICRASGGRVGNRRSQVYVDLIVLPSGIRMRIGSVATYRLECGIVMEIQLSVAAL